MYIEKSIIQPKSKYDEQSVSVDQYYITTSLYAFRNVI